MQAVGWGCATCPTPVAAAAAVAALDAEHGGPVAAAVAAAALQEGLACLHHAAPAMRFPCETRHAVLPGQAATAGKRWCYPHPAVPNSKARRPGWAELPELKQDSSDSREAATLRRMNTLHVRLCLLTRATV